MIARKLLILTERVPAFRSLRKVLCVLGAQRGATAADQTLFPVHILDRCELASLDSLVKLPDDARITALDEYDSVLLAGGAHPLTLLTLLSESPSQRGLSPCGRQWLPQLLHRTLWQIPCSSASASWAAALSRRAQQIVRLTERYFSAQEIGDHLDKLRALAEGSLPGDSVDEDDVYDFVRKGLEPRLSKVLNGGDSNDL